MNKAITIELQFFLISILSGAIVLSVYDVLRILRRVIKHNSIFIAIEDLIFWVVSSVFIFAMMYRQNNGIIRGFSVMGMAIGMILYHYILSELFVNLVTKLMNALLSPIRFVMRQVKRLLHYITFRGKKLINFLQLRLKKLSKLVTMKLGVKRNKRDEKRALRLKKKTEEQEIKRKKKAEKRKDAASKKQTKAKKKIADEKNSVSDHETRKVASFTKYPVLERITEAAQENQQIKDNGKNKRGIKEK